MMEFLYFPQDKAEYIPAVISLFIFFMGAVVAMYLFYKKSKRDEERFDADHSTDVNNLSLQRKNDDKK
ncbi:hypothetical protein [Aquibacillus albus]|uniref:Mg2+/citrate symporter n=1 Tax=Aquibacillus albus TaxID=1168171 RepID=A0ABS2MYG5_9BACI|nr:hypothetical protein [Aquibacillus albus]MBM7570921.1 Mg2+/citrate symporter [Aquibacillus albus]